MFLGQKYFVTRDVNVFYHAPGVQRLPNLGTVHITATIGIDKLQVNQTVNAAYFIRVVRHAM